MTKGSKTSSFGTSSRINHDASQYYRSKLNTGLAQAAGSQGVDNPFPVDCENHLISGSAENMKELPDNSLHLMVTSPPYNVTKEYDANLTLEEAEARRQDLPPG